MHAQRVSLISARSALRWSGVSIGFGLAFGVGVFFVRGPHVALTYFTAYLLEQLLSIDNLFVFFVVFRQLAIPSGHQQRVLYWGVLGALATRGAMLATGVFLFERFHWIVYPFGAVILFAATRLIWGRDQEREIVEKACAVCSSWIARVVPVTPVLHDGHFWVRAAGRIFATPLFIALVVIETTDVVFALDSIPAVLSITRDPLIVYTSNVFALLGTRSLYFLLADAAERFDRLRFGLAAILVFAGAKLLLSSVIEVSASLFLAVIVASFALAVLASTRPKQPRHRGSGTIV